MTRRLSRTTAIVTSFCLAGAAIAADQGRTALENHPVRAFQFETANTLPGGTLELNVGTMQTDPSAGSGTGNQVYFGGGAIAVNDQLSFGLDLSSYQDPTLKPILGSNPDIVMNIAAAWAKYNFVSTDRVTVSGLVSAENFIKLDSTLWGGLTRGHMAYSAKLPVSVSVSPALQFHLTPAVSIFPETVGGSQFYGTIISVGAGASLRASDRLAFYGAVDVPVSGGNTLTDTAGFTQVPVYTAGARFNLTPSVALDAYLTNGVGTTPATSILTFWPDGDTLLAGVRLTWTPGADNPPSYRGSFDAPGMRGRALQKPGITLASADVVEPGTVRVAAWGGTDENLGGALTLGAGRDGEIVVAVEDYADNGSVAPGLVPTVEPRYMFGPRLRLLDQTNGDPFSLTGELLFGRQLEPGVAGVGVFFLAATAGYQVNDRVALSLSPKVAAFGNTEVAALGAGANIALWEGLELMAEASAVGLDATDPVWAAGVRYHFGDSGFAVEAHATNAIGRMGIGSMIAQDETRFGISLTKSFDVPAWRGLVGP